MNANSVCRFIFALIFVIGSFSVNPRLSGAQPSSLDSRVFEWRFYVQTNPDLLQAGIVTKAQAQNHWLNAGIYEGRQAHPGFHSRQYLDRYADVRNAYGATNYLGAIQHYLSYGFNENRHGYIESGAYGRWTIRTNSANSDSNAIYVSASARMAGAIDSIVWGGREFINNYDHGRQLQIAFSKHPLGECYNPTQAGSIHDGFSWTSTSQLLSVAAWSNILSTWSKPAFWLNPNQFPQIREKCPYGFNTTIVSNYGIQTKIRIGDAVANAIRFSTSIVVPEPITTSLVIEGPIAYVTRDFATAYELIGTSTRILSQMEPSSQEHPNVVILATSDKNHAIGIWSPFLPQSGFGAYAYAYGNNVGSGASNDDFAETRWVRATFRSGVLAPNSVVPLCTYVVVGSLTTVRGTIIQLKSTPVSNLCS